MSKYKFLIIIFLLLLSVFVISESSEIYRENKNGTVADNRLKKIWAQKDSYIELGRWINWKEANRYKRKKNEIKFGGFDDWRIPSRKELKSLFLKKKWQWTYDKGSKIYMSELFETGFCYFWTNEQLKNKTIWQVSLCDGKAYQTEAINRHGNSVILIRP